MRDSSAFAREHETVGLAAASSPKLSQRMDARSLLADQIIEISDRSHGDVWVDADGNERTDTERVELEIEKQSNNSKRGGARPGAATGLARQDLALRTRWFHCLAATAGPIAFIFAHSVCATAVANLKLYVKSGRRRMSSLTKSATQVSRVSG